MWDRSWIRTVCVSALLAASPGAYAAAPPSEILSPSGNWQIAAGQIELAPGQAVQYCSISNDYANKGRLEFYGTDGKLAAIKIDIPGREFRADQSFTVGLRIPGGYNPQFGASVVGTSTLILNVKGDEGLATSLHNGQLLYVGLEGQEYAFSLSGINNFGERMRTCKDSQGLGEMVQNFLFKAGPEQRAELERAGIQSETLEILAAPPTSDPSMIVQNIPEPVPLAAPPMQPPPAMPQAQNLSQPPQFAPPPPSMPAGPQALVSPMVASETLPPIPPRGQVLASIGENTALSPQPPAGSAMPPPAPHGGGFDELFTPNAALPPGGPADPPQMAIPAPVVAQQAPQPILQQTPPPAANTSIPAMSVTEGLPPRPQAAPPAATFSSNGAISGEAPQWRALKGSSLREVLALWAMDNQVELIWNAEEQYRVKETLSLNSSFEGAVEILLKQFETDFPAPGVRRPVGQLYVDPAQNKKVLVIKSQIG